MYDLFKSIVILCVDYCRILRCKVPFSTAAEGQYTSHKLQVVKVPAPETISPERLDISTGAKTGMMKTTQVVLYQSKRSRILGTCIG